MKTSLLSVIILLAIVATTKAQHSPQDLKREATLKGTYRGRYRDTARIRFKAELEIKNFYFYEFIAGSKDLDCRSSLGNWTNKGDTLILVSFEENQLPEKYQFQTLFCKWRKFNKSHFLIKKNKLIHLYRNQRGKWRRGVVYRKKKK